MFQYVTYLLIILVIGFLVYWMQGGEDGFSGKLEAPSEIMAELADQRIEYSRHAKCRMECREITKKEIKEVLENGKINARKSKPNDEPCPSYAIEGITSDQQKVRIVVGDCGNKTKVITAIDLKNKYECHCP